MRAYIDNENKLHVENDGTMTAVDVDLGGQCKRVIEAYKYYPDKGILILWGNADKTFGAQALFSELSESIAKAVDGLDDAASEDVTDLFPFWGVGIEYAIDDKRQYNALLYRCIQAHTSQADWTPDVAVSLWVRTSAEEWIPWYQPTGAHDAYQTGDRVHYKTASDPVYESLIDGNVWSPDDYPAGWRQLLTEE